MPIKVIIPSGQTEITVHGLHQWDYGQRIEIHDVDLPGLIEVHFACLGMDEAVVRSCSVVDGVATAAVPDLCLEQTTPITAWIYIINGTRGETQKVIHLPIIARTRPAASESVPDEYTDKYTELVTAAGAVIAEAESIKDAMGNEMQDILDGAVDNVTNSAAERVSNGISQGTITVTKASHAYTADKLTSSRFLHNCSVRSNSGDFFLYTSFVNASKVEAWRLSVFKNAVLALRAYVPIMATGYMIGAAGIVVPIMAIYHDGENICIKFANTDYEDSYLGNLDISELSGVTGASVPLNEYEEWVE